MNAIATANGDILVRTITRNDTPITVYNFEVETDHTYFVSDNGLWVHNANEICDLASREHRATVQNPLSQSQIDEIRDIPRGQRPPPSDYLDEAYIASHLARFDGGSTRFVTRSSYDEFGVGKPDGTEFVIPKNQADRILAETNGNPRALEDALGLERGTLQNDGLIRIDFNDEVNTTVRIADGNEFGANDQWIPGGFLPDGTPEAVVQLPSGSTASSGLFTITDL